LREKREERREAREEREREEKRGEEMTSAERGNEKSLVWF
jgi:hypothetical protein